MTSVAKHIMKMPEVSSVNFYLSKLNAKFFYETLLECGIQVHISQHPSETAEGPWVNSNYKIDSPSEIADFTICDTVIWPLENSARSVLFANFLWEDYWDYLKSESSESFKAFSSENYKKLENVRVFGNDCFATTTIRRTKNFTALPVIDYWNFREKSINLKKNFSFPVHFKVSLGGTGDMQLKMNDSSKILDLGWEPSKEAIQNSILSNTNLVVVARAGVSTISECISAGIPIICLYDSQDPELYENAMLVNSQRWGLAIDLNHKEFTSQIEAAKQELTQNYEEYRSRLLAQPICSSDFVARLLLSGEFL